MSEEIKEMRKHKTTGVLIYQIDGDWYELDQIYREEISEEIAEEEINEVIFKREG